MENNSILEETLLERVNMFGAERRVIEEVFQTAEQLECDPETLETGIYKRYRACMEEFWAMIDEVYPKQSRR